MQLIKDGKAWNDQNLRRDAESAQEKTIFQKED
jgi:hypothetical protein